MRRLLLLLDKKRSTCLRSFQHLRVRCSNPSGLRRQSCSWLLRRPPVSLSSLTAGELRGPGPDGQRRLAGGGLFGYPVRRRSQSSWSSTSCCHHPGAGPSELSTPSGPTQPHWGQSGLPALGLTPMARAAGRNRSQTLAVMSPIPQPLGHTAAWEGRGLFGYPVRRRSQSSWSSTSCCHHRVPAQVRGACLVTQYVAARSPAGQAPAAATIRVPAQVGSRHRQGRRNRTGGRGRGGGGACLVTQDVAARSPPGQAPAAATIRVPAQVGSRHRQGRRNRTGGRGETVVCSWGGIERRLTVKEEHCNSWS